MRRLILWVEYLLTERIILGIAKVFTEERIPTPSEHKTFKGKEKKFNGLWSSTVIKRILTNPTYIGNLTQNRSHKVNYKIKQIRVLPKEQWITIDNTHEAIISQEDFDMVQRLLSKKNYVKRENNKPISKHLLSGLLFCGDCNSKMTFLQGKKTDGYVVCSTWKKYCRLRLCTSHRLKEKYVESYVISTLKETAEKYIDQRELLNNNYAIGYEKVVIQLKKEKSNIEKQLDEIKTVIMSLYKDKVKGTISEIDYIEMSKEFSGQRETLTARLDSIAKEISGTEETKDNSQAMEQYLKKFLSFENVDRGTLVNLIEKIEIHEGKSIFIKFNFADPRETL